MATVSLEEVLSRYITESKFAEIPAEAILVAKRTVLNNLGTIIAGAKETGIGPLVDQARDRGGKPEATILMYGGKVPAYNAGFVNSVMARALDFDDSIMPGVHIGASAVPAALAVAELTGGCSGREFLAALIMGTEVSARLNLSDEQYNGFDPTGVCAVFAAAAVAGRLLGLNSRQIRHALALAFNRSAGSYQSHISGALAVRLTQGFVSQTGIQCAQLAKIGMTGPEDFLDGIYGYFHLYGKDKGNNGAVLEGLGHRYELTRTMFKKYPSCGATQGSVEAILELLRQCHFSEREVASIEVYVTPATHRLAGKDFQIRANPRVDAQFNIQYCVASALLRKSSRLEHFDRAMVTEPEIARVAGKVRVLVDPALDAKGLTAVSLLVKTTDGTVYRSSLDIAPGFPGNPLTDEDHHCRFQECIEYAAGYYPSENLPGIISLVDRLEEVEDVRGLVPLLKI
jgi:2-methylcitrate dehydratase PrpD